MIVYLDTSAVVKLYVDEIGSAETRTAVLGARAVNTHLITYAEACAAFARIGRERGDTLFFSRVRAELDRAWKIWRIVGVDEGLIQRAGDLAHEFGLRGYDSVHLAAAEAVGTALPGVRFRVAVFDGKLANAVGALGMRVLG